MDRQTEIRLINEAIDLHKSGETQVSEAANSQSIERYVSDDWFELEKQRFFDRLPTPVAVVGEVPESGSYMAITGLNGRPLLITRDRDQQIRVFANICRHRNTRLVEEGSGCRHRFTCPYHAWTYGNNGKLIAAPEFEKGGFDALGKDNLGLIEFDVKVVNGLVFIHPDPTKTLDDDFLPAEMASGMAFLHLESQKVYKKRDYVLNANWKVILEGGIEAYHYDVAHKNTLSPFFLGNLGTWESWGPYMRMVMPKKPMLEAEQMPQEQWDIRTFANILYQLPPTLTLLAQPDNLSLIRAIPLSAHQTKIEEVLLVEPPADGSDQWSDDELKMHETNFNLVNKILSEDWVLGESIQANMKSGLVNEVHFGRFESALTDFNHHYMAAMERG